MKYGEPTSEILFINACVRRGSRTRQLADCLLSTLDGSVTEVRLIDIPFPAVNEEFLAKRDRLISERDYSAPMFGLAKQFAKADIVVIAAPYWDLSFPASLKQYLEQINITGVTFFYTPKGVPQGLCRAKQLFYISTAGGNYVPEEFGFGYVKALAQNFYGIPEVRFFNAAGLDIDGADPEHIIREAMDRIRNR